MNAIASIKNKAAVTALLSVILGLVFLNNINEMKTTTKINRAIATIYDDRLVVEGYIFDYAQHLQQIIETTGNQNSNAQAAFHLTEIEKLNALYANTKLTTAEKANFDRFVSLYNNIENSIKNNDSQKAIHYAKAAKHILPVLSDIQVNEATAEMNGLKKLFGASSISSQFETGILVVISLLILALQFSGKTIRPEHFPKSPSLN